MFRYIDREFDIRIKQLDLEHFSNLALNGKNRVALGIQYRFEEVFAYEEENELRFTEEYNYTTAPQYTEFVHRFRAEHRMAPSITYHRFRYNFSISRSFKRVKMSTSDTYFTGNLEMLLTVAADHQPVYEQLVSAGVGWGISDNLQLEVSSEYRFTDFTQDPGMSFCNYRDDSQPLDLIAFFRFPLL
jgi:hypothetical protein